MDKRNQEWSDDGENEHGQLLLELLNDLGQHRDLFNSVRNALHDIIVKFNGRHDLSEHLLDIDGELLRLTRGDGGVRHLSRRRIFLQLVDLVTLVLVSKDAVRDLVKKVTEHAGISPGTLLQSTFKLLNLVLGELIGNLKDVSDIIFGQWSKSKTYLHQ